MKNQNKIRTIAFYLPQFYPTVENDEWWGKGFTEWTNVAKARPLFKGHYQPKIPADLGFYDLRLSETREAQAKLAEECGIEGFCYWHYWFAGKRLLDRVFREVVESGKPDYPFCLCWANHSWYAKTWDANSPNKLLIEQTYPGKDDYVNHFNELLPAFKDERYMRSRDGRLIFALYAPLDLPQPKEFFDTWNELAGKNGLNGFYFLGFTMHPYDKDRILEKAYDGAILDYVFMQNADNKSIINRIKRKITRSIFKLPQISDYNLYVKYLLEQYESLDNQYPCILPNFDHSPRSKNRGVIMINSTPKNWGHLLTNIKEKLQNKKDENFLFIKAWNEWGEGNYLEPDIKYGHGYLDEIKNILNNQL